MFGVVNNLIINQHSLGKYLEESRKLIKEIIYYCFEMYYGCKIIIQYYRCMDIKGCVICTYLIFYILTIAIVEIFIEICNIYVYYKIFILFIDNLSV